MSRDLTTSSVARQNILNNPFAVSEIEKAAGIKCVEFEGKRIALKAQVAAFFEIAERTIDDHVAQHGDELARNGYELIKGKRLKTLKTAIQEAQLDELNFVEFKHAPQLSVFDFRAFLNLAMLLTTSSRARQLRQIILDITIDTLNQRAGGSTKYINQRDDEYLQAAFDADNYRKQYTDALKDCIDAGNFKFATFTDKVYEAIFLEKAKEYRALLKLEAKDSTRSTFYREVLDLIASLEFAVSTALRDEMKKKGRKLGYREADVVFTSVATVPLYMPLMASARRTMASRDHALRGVTHGKLENYITSVSRADFERFLGEQSKELADRLKDAEDVLKRLKDR